MTEERPQPQNENENEMADGVELEGPRLVAQFSGPIDDPETELVILAGEGFPPFLVSVWFSPHTYQYRLVWQGLHPAQRSALVDDLRIRTEMDHAALIQQSRESGKMNRILVPGKEGGMNLRTPPNIK